MTHDNTVLNLNATQAILIIDDDEADRKHIARALSKYEVLEATTLEEGLALVEEQSLQCVFLDYFIPPHDGLSAIPKILSISPELPIIMMTGGDSEELEEQALDTGAVDYISKNNASNEAISHVVRLAKSQRRRKKKTYSQSEDLMGFCSVLAHDMSAPIRHINGFMRFIEEDIKAQKYDKLEDYFGFIRIATKKMISLVDGLYEYTKFEKPAVFSSMDVRLAIDEAIELLETEITEKSVVIECGDMPTVIGNKDLLVLLFFQLLKNAILFNESTPPKITISAEKKESQWWVFVKDNGMGIEESKLEKIFEPFQKLHIESTYATGAGLGLTLVRKIVHRHRGEVFCKSVVGEGTELYFSLG